jgi:hypothetical protein
MSCVAAGPSPYQSEIRGLGSAFGASPVSVKSCGFRNFWSKILAETNKVHQVTKVQRVLPYKALIKGRDDISK